LCSIIRSMSRSLKVPLIASLSIFKESVLRLYVYSMELSVFFCEYVFPSQYVF